MKFRKKMTTMIDEMNACSYSVSNVVGFDEKFARETFREAMLDTRLVDIACNRRLRFAPTKREDVAHLAAHFAFCISPSILRIENSRNST
jgi:hypothetical protein